MKNRFLSSLLIVLATFATRTVSAQKPARSPAAKPAPARAETNASTSEPSSPNYLLSPSDLVRVLVFQEDDMDWTARVSRDGTLVLPLVGAINVNHRTPDELGVVVRDRLHDGYLVHPQVSVTILDFAKRRFTILGQVQKPGQIDIPDNSTVDVLQAIGMAGGYTPRADAGRVVVKRAVNGKEIVLRMDARRMAKDPAATPFEILPGDTVTVFEALF